MPRNSKKTKDYVKQHAKRGNIKKPVRTIKPRISKTRKPK